jgi:hypothetical protein
MDPWNVYMYLDDKYCSCARMNVVATTSAMHGINSLNDNTET